MSTNTKVVEQAYAAFQQGDIPGLMALIDDDVEWTSPRTLPHGGEFHGSTGVGKFFEGIGGAWDPLGIDVETVAEAGGDLVLGVIRADGTLRGGKPAGYGATHLFNIRNGKITRFREYVDSDAAID